MNTRFNAILGCLAALMMIACNENKQGTPGTTSTSAATAGTEATLVIVSYGGAYQKAQHDGFFAQFSRDHHVRIVEQEWSGDIARLKAMVESGNVTWDVVDAEDYIVPRAADENLLERLSPSVTAGLNIPPGATTEYGAAVCYWSTVLGYNTKLLQGKQPPSGWKDFFDTKRYPGPRSLRKSPVSTLEVALLADGVAPASLYPLDVDRAFRALDRIKPSVSVWWEAGEQPAQLLASGEVAMSSIWNGRAYNAAKAGKPVAFTWNGGLLSSDWWIVPRGSKNKALAEEFIRFATTAPAQAEFAKHIPYGPINSDAFALLSPEIKTDLPTAPDNFSKQQALRRDWWNAHEAELTKRFNDWLLK